jgi:hypothetical protein
MARHSVLYTVGALTLLLHLTAAAVTVKVEPKMEECFWEDLEQGQITEVLYNVLDGGLLDIEFRVCNLGNSVGREPINIDFLLGKGEEGKLRPIFQNAF